MSLIYSINVEMAIRKLTANHDYDGNLIGEMFRSMLDCESALHYVEYFGFMPLIKIDKIYMAYDLYEGLIGTEANPVNSLLRDYFYGVIEVIGDELYEARIKHVNTNFDFCFGTQIPGVDAVTFMPKKESADQGASLYFGPAVSSEDLKQMVDEISEMASMICVPNGCTAAPGSASRNN